jgi:hypothetical protein
MILLRNAILFMQYPCSRKSRQVNNGCGKWE